MILIITTTHRKSVAVKIGKDLLKERFIVCYNLIPVESAYWWKGKILDENETLIILKTKKENFKKVENYIQKYSGYEIPEIIGIKTTKVNQRYLNWVKTETK